MRSQKKYRDGARELVKQRARERYHKNSAKINQATTDWRKAHPDQWNARMKRYRDKVRGQVLAAYGGRCVCCGESHPEFLAIDHIYNDGAKERREFSGSAMYLMLKRKKYPRDRYQLLCHNCNVAKAKYGACPHVAERGKK